MYIWQAKDWPNFEYDLHDLAEKITNIEQLQASLISKTSALTEPVDKEAQMDALLQNAIRTSEIEGEKLDVSSVRSSVANQLGLINAGINKGTKQSDSLVTMLLLATDQLEQDLTLDSLCLLVPA